MARILVVDDDPLFLAIMSRSLEKARHEIVISSDPSKAIDIFAQAECEAVVCALTLPDHASMEFIRAARHHAPDLAIIAVVAGKAHLPDLNPDIVRMLQAIGANEVVKKPFEVLDFIARVELTIALRRQAAATSTSAAGY
jgi:DNA-binding response OmpR family regulator